MGKIIVLDVTGTGTDYLGQAIISLGFEPCFIYSIGLCSGDALKALRKYLHYEIEDTSNVKNILSVIRNNNIFNIDAVITMLDSRLAIVAQLASLLNIRGNDHTCIFLYNKSSVQQLIPEFSPPTLQIKKTERLEELYGFFEQYGTLIAKPSFSAGGVGLSKIQSKYDVVYFLEHTLQNHDYNDGWVIQPYIEGDLISIEGFVINGNVFFIGVSKRYKVLDTESVNIFPGIISLAIKDRAQEAVVELVKRSQYKNGYFHSEFIVTTDNCYLIDANLGRVAGGGVGLQYALSFGISPIEFYKHIVAVTLCIDKHINHNIYNSTPKETLAINYGIEGKHLIKNIDLPTVHYVKHVQLIDDLSFSIPYGLSNLSIIGVVYGVTKSVSEYIGNIKIITTNGIKKPLYADISSR